MLAVLQPGQSPTCNGRLNWAADRYRLHPSILGMDWNGTSTDYKISDILRA